MAHGQVMSKWMDTIRSGQQGYSRCHSLWGTRSMMGVARALHGGWARGSLSSK
jgi:hypothetical protein